MCENAQQENMVFSAKILESEKMIILNNGYYALRVQLSKFRCSELPQTDRVLPGPTVTS